jgi:multidrug efflux system outer membrane protein
MHEQGLVTGLDARMANIKAAEIEAQRVGAAAQAENALSALRAMMDFPDSTALVLTDRLSDAPLVAACARTESAECFFDQRSDLQAYRLGAEAAGHGVKKALAAQLPAIAAFGSVGHYARNAPLGDGSGDWTIGIGLSWTPFQGLSGVGSVKAAKAEREAAEAQRDAAVLQAELEVRQATRLLSAAEERVRVAASAAQEAQVALEQARLRYRTGTAPITELLDVQAAATNATLTELSARRDLFISHAALDLAYGVHDR